jgi:predicted amidohydrolase YtcJ
VKARSGQNTKEIDLAGRLLLPGFNDAHDHFYKSMWQKQWANLGARGSTHTVEVYRQAIAEYRAKHPDLKQLQGFGYDALILPAIAQSQKRQPRELLDDLVSDVPAIIRSWQGHHAWVNSKALALAGVTKDTANPSMVQDTGFDRDPTTGEPNGILQEAASWNVIYDALPDEAYFSVEQYRSGILDWQREMAAPRGITGMLVPAGFLKSYNIFYAAQQLSDEDKLTMHYSLARWVDDLAGLEQVPELIAWRAKFRGGPNFRFNTLKIYLPWPHPPIEVGRTFAALDKAGFQLYTHVVPTPGTTPWAQALDAYEYTAKQNGSIKDKRHVITHHRPQMVPLVPRYKALGLRADIDWQTVRDYYKSFKAFLDAGVPVELSSDYPSRDPNPLPWIAECAQAGLPLEKVVDSLTITPAETMFAEKVTGSITVGKAADVIVLDRDLFKVAPREIEGAKVLLTLFAGQELYRDPSFQ